MPSKHKSGWECLLTIKIFLKYSLQEDKTNLWAETCCWSSLTRVTSKNSSSFLSLLNDDVTFVWKSFHLRQNFSDMFDGNGGKLLDTSWSESNRYTRNMNVPKWTTRELFNFHKWQCWSYSLPPCSQTCAAVLPSTRHSPHYIYYLHSRCGQCRYIDIATLDTVDM